MEYFDILDRVGGLEPPPSATTTQCILWHQGFYIYSIFDCPNRIRFISEDKFIDPFI